MRNSVGTDKRGGGYTRYAEIRVCVGMHTPICAFACYAPTYAYRIEGIEGQALLFASGCGCELWIPRPMSFDTAPTLLSSAAMFV